MSYDFNEIINRKNTYSLKYDMAPKYGMPEDTLPLWVADMDFRTPNEVTDALKEVAEHGIFGYSEPDSAYFEAVHNWFKNNFDYLTEEEWLVKTPSIVFGLAMAVRAFTEPGDSVMIQNPVYYPFSEVIRDNGRKTVNNSLVYQNGKYLMDFDDMEDKIIKDKVKLFILCSPHNPVGRVWKKEELNRVGEICLKHNVLIVSDEIHCDFVYEGNKHIVFSTLNEDFAQNSIIMTAPTKTFNLAALQISNIFIKNKKIRTRFKHEINKAGYSQLGIMGLVAAKNAYLYGRTWLDELLVYLSGNIRFVHDFLLENLPEIKLIEPEGTYLIWLDCKNLGYTHKELDNVIINKSKLWLDSGDIFGKEGNGFQRINIACPRLTLENAMSKLRDGLLNVK